MIISGRPAINFICFVLCLIISMQINIDTDPPSAATHKSEFSDNLLFPRTAKILSAIVITAAIAEIAAKYRNINFKSIVFFLIYNKNYLG